MYRELLLAIAWLVAQARLLERGLKQHASQLFVAALLPPYPEVTLEFTQCNQFSLVGVFSVQPAKTGCRIALSFLHAVRVSACFKGNAVISIVASNSRAAFVKLMA